MNEYYDLNYKQYIPDDRRAAILDIGCGEGALVEYLYNQGHRDITAIDADEAALSRIKIKEKIKTINAKVDANFIRSIDRNFDIIVMKQMIYYIDRKNIYDFLSAIWERLSENGTLIVEIFNGSMISGRFTEVKDPYILTAYSEHSLRKILETTNFEIIALTGHQSTSRSFKFRLYTLAQKIWFMLYRMILIIERGKDDELPRIRQKNVIAVARKKN